MPGGAVEIEMRRILKFPPDLKSGYAGRLGNPAATRDYARVRRESGEFAHRNGYGSRGVG